MENTENKRICPLTQKPCLITDCAWWSYQGECTIETLSNVAEKLEDIATAIDGLKNAVENKEFY